MVFQLFRVFWDSECNDAPGQTRVKRLADINTDTKIGGGHFTQNDPTYTLINIHGPTAAWTIGLTVVLAVIAGIIWYWHYRRQKKLKRAVTRHRLARWSAIGYHKTECNKIDHTKECDCKPAPGRFDRANEAEDMEDPCYRRPHIYDV